jgi:hypothetical protein
MAKVIHLFGETRTNLTPTTHPQTKFISSRHTQHKEHLVSFADQRSCAATTEHLKMAVPTKTCPTITHTLHQTILSFHQRLNVEHHANFALWISFAGITAKTKA